MDQNISAQSPKFVGKKFRLVEKKTHLEVVWSPLSSSMTASKTLWAKFNVEKQEFLLKLVILTIAAILGENNFKPAFFQTNNQ